MLAQRWPAAEIFGIDSSEEMLETAKAVNAPGQFMRQDIKEWSTLPGESDLIFSNAALQWVPEHSTLIPRLMQRVSPMGALAFQMPSGSDAPAHIAARDLAASGSWQGKFAITVDTWQVGSAESYYDLLSPHATQVDIWTTEYLHALPSLDAIVEWYRGSSLRPYLDALRTLTDRNEFLAQYAVALRSHYPVRTSARVLLPFRRLFVIAYR